MNETPSIESLIERFLDDRESLSDAEFNRLLEALRTQPQLAERLKDQLMLEEHLAQHFSKDRQAFPARFERRQVVESPSPGIDPLKKNGEEAIETYDLRREEVRTNGSASMDQRSLESGQRKTLKSAEPDLQKQAKQAASRSPWRTTSLVVLFLLLTAGGLLWLEYSDAARKVAVVGQVRGMALIYRDGVGTVAAPGMLILPGDEIQVQDDGELEFSYRDESKARIKGETKFQIQPGAEILPGLLSMNLSKEIEISRGNLELDVKPQPENRMMVIKTPQVQATVLGTRLIVSVQEQQSRLEVLDGRIRVKFLHQQESSTELAAGRTSARDEPRVSRKFRALALGSHGFSLPARSLGHAIKPAGRRLAGLC